MKRIIYLVISPIFLLSGVAIFFYTQDIKHDDKIELSCTRTSNGEGMKVFNLTIHPHKTGASQVLFNDSPATFEESGKIKVAVINLHVTTSLITFIQNGKMIDFQNQSKKNLNTDKADRSWSRFYEINRSDGSYRQEITDFIPNQSNSLKEEFGTCEKRKSNKF